ncbi:MAG TPA: ABC transporter ATP-binding protein [Streptosporangiaceae bacterium]|nr:ABC transporter ATP-binding protein [Streptosporangiaceae bacterium]
MYALLGPNGAGKTTTMEILEGHRKRTSGSVQVLGFDPGAAGRHFRERIGIVLQSGGVDAELTVREMVALYASFYARPRDVAATIEQVGLAGKRRARVRTLSGGQLRRLDLALALVGDPELLFLDEPTTGFDPNARRDAWEMIAGLRQGGTTILLTSHYLDEVQRLADRVGVMSHGHLVEESTPDALGGRDLAGTVISFCLPAALPAAGLPAGPWDLAEDHNGEVTMHTDEPTRVLFTLTRWAVAHGVELEGLSVVRPSLEDAYLRITGEAGAEAAMSADATRGSRPAPLLALGQVRYQLLLLLRSPLGFFITLVIPLLLLIVLNVIHPPTAALPRGLRYAQFLTPR